MLFLRRAFRSRISSPAGSNSEPNAPFAGTHRLGGGRCHTPRPSHKHDFRCLVCRPQAFFEKAGIERRRQGGRPTCSVFAVSGALEFAFSQHQLHEQVSPEFLNWAANQVTGSHQDGGFFSDLWAGFQAHGICTEQQMPYRDHFDPSYNPEPQTLALAKARLNLGMQLHWIKPWDVKTGLTETHQAQIKQTLQHGFPVCAGMRWPKSETWAENILGMCEPEAVQDGHSVLLVGYRDDPAQPGGGLFLFRNSGRQGRDGFMPYAYARAYINDALWIEAQGKSRVNLSP